MSPRGCSFTPSGGRVLGKEVLQAEMKKRYAEYFAEFVARGISAELLDERLANFD